jgi:hypothetical protein
MLGHVHHGICKHMEQERGGGGTGANEGALEEIATCHDVVGGRLRPAA